MLSEEKNIFSKCTVLCSNVFSNSQRLLFRTVLFSTVNSNVHRQPPRKERNKKVLYDSLLC